jgi:hypothetical protein
LANEHNIGVRFGAEGIPQMARALEGLRDSFSSVGDAAEDAAKGFAQIGPAMQRATENVHRFKAGLRTDPTGQTSILNTAKGFDGIDKSSRAATNAVRAFSNATSAGNGVVTDFSRVIQDLPFGFLGIANNLTQLPGSLQRLSAAAKESGKSIGSLLFSAATGFSGIGLILSAVTSGLLIAQNGMMGFGRASKKAQEDADELAKTIRSIGDIRGEAIGGVQGQVAQVNILAEAVSDSNLPYAQRKRALEELKDINKAYFGDLKLEDAATGKLTKTVDEYTKALVSSAIVKSFVNEIAEVSKAAIKSDAELTKATDRLARAEKALKAARSTGGLRGREGTAETSAAIDANNELITAFEQQRSLREKTLDLETQRTVLHDQLNKALKESIQFKDLDSKGSEREVDLLQKRLTALEKIREATKDLSVVANLQEQIFDLQVKITLRDAAKNGLSKEETDLAIKGFRDQLTEAFSKEALSFEAIPKVKVTRVELAPIEPSAIESAIAKATGFDKKIPIESDRQVQIRLLGLEFVLAQEEAQKAVEKLRDTVVNGAIESFAAVGNSLGEALAGAFSGAGIGEGLAKAASSFLSGIGGVLQEIGKQIIATSTLIKALKESLKTLITNPVAAIGVGLGLVALGGLLKSIKIPAFAGGVNNFSGGLALVGERGPELVNLPRGSDVIPNHMLGADGVNISLVPTIRFSMADFIIGFERGQERRRRLG